MGTNGLPAGRQKPPCRFAPEVLMNSVGFSDLPNPLHPPLSGGQTAFRPAGRQKPPCRFAPEVLMNSVGFSDLPNPLHPLPGGQTAFRPVGRSRLVASLRKFYCRLCTSLQTRTSCRHIHKSQSLEWRRLPRFRHTIGTAATILCFL